MKKIGLALSILTVALLLAGCAGFGPPVIKSSDILDSQARQFSPPAGRAAIYIIRPYQFVAAGSPIEAFLDHDSIGWLPPGSFLYGEILPRKHIIEVGMIGNNSSLRFMAEEGKCYFFHTEANLGSLSLEEITIEKGKKLVGKYQLSGQNKFDTGDEAPLKLK